MRPHRGVPMLAAALALALTAVPVASGHQMGGGGGSGPSVATSVPLTPHALGLPGGTVNPTAAPQTALVAHRSGEGVSSPTPYSLGLPGGTLNPTGAQQTDRFQNRSAQGVSAPGVSPRTYRFGLGGVELSRWEAQRIALGHQSGDALGWLIIIGAVAFVVIGTAVASRRQRAPEQGSSQTVQTA